MQVDSSTCQCPLVSFFFMLASWDFCTASHFMANNEAQTIRWPIKIDAIQCEERIDILCKHCIFSLKWHIDKLHRMIFSVSLCVCVWLFVHTENAMRCYTFSSVHQLLLEHNMKNMLFAQKLHIFWNIEWCFDLIYLTVRNTEK